MASSFKFNIIPFFFFLCFLSSSSVTADSPVQSQSLKVPVSEFVASVKSAINEVRQVTSFVSQYQNASQDFRVANAVSDCLILLNLSAQALDWTLGASLSPNGSTVVSTGELSSDLKTWLSGVLVNHDTCLEGFDGITNDVKKIVEPKLKQIPILIFNILANVHSETNFKPNLDGNKKIRVSSWGIRKKGRKLVGGDVKYSDGITADVVVAQDGTGDYTSVSDAVDASPDYSVQPYVIYVKKGVYKEYVEVSSEKWNIILVGDGIDATVISGSRNFVDGFKPYSSATLGVKGRGFIAQDITIENTSGPEKHQAVAFLSDSDLSVLFRCAIRGYQGSLYAHTNRQFYKNCIITGTIDFIFGRAAAVFQNCQILARKGLSRQRNTITSQGRRSIREQSGFSIQFSNISAEEPDVVNTTLTYLGRPEGQFSTTVILQSNISNVINPRGWLEWDKDFALETLYYGEYKNSGPGAALENRVRWTGFHVITDANAAGNFTVAQLIAGNAWLPWTGIKYVAGLDS